MSVGRNGSLYFLLRPKLAIEAGGKSPLFLFSLNSSTCCLEWLVGEMLQLEDNKINKVRKWDL